MTKIIRIAEDFSPYPAGRSKSDGPATGERFREEFLAPSLREGSVKLILDNVAGLPSSFLEEAIGGLIRHGFSLSDLERNLIIVAETSRMKGYPEIARKYMLEEACRSSIKSN